MQKVGLDWSLLAFMPMKGGSSRIGGREGPLPRTLPPYSCCVYFVLFPTGCCLRADCQQRPPIPEENTGREREESEANMLEQSGGGRTQIGVPA